MARDCLYETDVCVCVWSEQGIFVEKKTDEPMATKQQTRMKHELSQLNESKRKGRKKNEEGVCSSSKTSSRPTALPLSDGDGRWKHKNNGNGCGAGSSDVPQAQIEDGQLRQLHDALQSAGGDLGAAVQVDAAQVPQMVRHRLRSI